MYYIIITIDEIVQYFVGWEEKLPIFSVDKYIAYNTKDKNKAINEKYKIEKCLNNSNIKYKNLAIINYNNKNIFL